MSEVAQPTIRQLRQRVFALSWPVVAETTLQLSLDLVNTALVVALGTAALAGVGAAMQLMAFALAILAALAMGAAILVAHATGARDFARASTIARQAIVWAGILAAPLTVAGFFGAGPIVGIFGLDATASGLGADYLRISMGTVFVLVALAVGSSVLRGSGDTRTPMRAILVANGLNVVLAWALIGGHLGLPALGVTGAAIATLISRLVALVIVGDALWRGPVNLRTRTGWRPRWTEGRELLGLGTPAALEQVAISLGWLGFTIVVGHMGTEELAVQRMATSIMSIATLTALGLQLATTTLVGQALGAGDPRTASRLAAITTRWALVLVTAIAGVLWFAAEPVVRLLVGGTEPELLKLGVDTLRMTLILQPFWAVTMVQSGALRGMRDTVSPLVVEASANWLAAGTAGWLVFQQGASLPQAWGAYLVVAPFLVGVMVARQLRRGRCLNADHTAAGPPALVGADAPAEGEPGVPAAACQADQPR